MNLDMKQNPDPKKCPAWFGSGSISKGYESTSLLVSEAFYLFLGLIVESHVLYDPITIIIIYETPTRIEIFLSLLYKS